MYEGLNKNGHSQSLEEHTDNKHIVETEPLRGKKNNGERSIRIGLFFNNLPRTVKPHDTRSNLTRVQTSDPTRFENLCIYMHCSLFQNLNQIASALLKVELTGEPRNFDLLPPPARIQMGFVVGVVAAHILHPYFSCCRPSTHFTFSPSSAKEFAG